MKKKIIPYVENNLLDWLNDCESKTLLDILDNIGECGKVFIKTNFKKCILYSPCTRIFTKWFWGWVILEWDLKNMHTFVCRAVIIPHTCIVCHNVSKIRYTEFLISVLPVKTTPWVFFLNIYNQIQGSYLNIL